ncbi:hypothetical protein Syun_005066 [Stephania yunnanensis]|uniref:Uncharacterized protein n=1 Tax=Stephania yunnanensis TaxID=152371 RepID=A0AAP0L7Q6_9MAGN
MEKKIALAVVCVALLLKPIHAETTEKDDAFGLNIETYKPTGSSAERAYEDAQQILKDAYESAQQSACESANAKYESAKENESHAIGDMGAQMRNPQDEL